MREQRRLAAIVSADVVGYSRLMGRDESGTVARLRQARAERLQPILARRGGRVVKLTGDGALIEFGSAVEALSAAIEFQQTMTESEAARPESERLVFRIGVHLGDVIVDGDDLYGDGVNVAARLEAEAPAGCIVISGDMHNFAAGRVAATFEDLGRLALKNIERPVQAYAIRWQANDWPPASAVAPPSATAVPAPPDAPLPLPDKPSIAVLPFQNMSGDPEQEYFADGVAEDIITMLSHCRSLFVIARNSSFAYKGRAVDVKQVSRELGVRYLMEGSVRRGGNRVRVSAQLIDAETGNHLWAERYDRDLSDVFAVQDEITEAVAIAIEPAVAEMERQRAVRRPPESLHAWESYQRGLWHIAHLSSMEHEKAMNSFRHAIDLDPNFAAVYSSLALATMLEAPLYQNRGIDEGVREAVALARRAISLDPTDALGHSCLAKR